MAGNIKEIGNSEFAEEVLNKKMVVVDFYSTECPPCEALASKYINLSELYGEDISFVKIFRQGNRAEKCRFIQAGAGHYIIDVFKQELFLIRRYIAAPNNVLEQGMGCFREKVPQAAGR